MKISKVSVFILIIILMSSCIFKNADLESKNSCENNMNSKNKDFEKIYYDDGSLKAIIPIRNDTINGLSQEFYNNGKLKEIRRYVNGSLEGVLYQYNKNQSYVSTEEFFLKDKLIVKCNIGNIIGKDTLYGITYYYPESILTKSEFLPAGSVSYKLNGHLDTLSTNYYRVVSRDTIKYGENYKLKIELNIGIVKNISFRLILGDLDTLLNFVKPETLTEYQSIGNKLELNINDYKAGSNLIMGKLFIQKNGIDLLSQDYLHPSIHYLIFYNQFFVE
ncbi:MAG: hypothetical protein H6540_05570 [Bacteroidales bacterium]|nr:hypothetical protein [Bacteroidales bacterium]MCB9012943.1 hypothetical protein [Bacteroidales bacterium]